MPEQRTEPEHSNLNLGNILFALFRWKRTILGLTILGLIAAAVVHYRYPRAYESDARLLVRYVLERSGYDPVDTLSGQSARGGSGLTIDAVIAAEVSILTSWDLSVQVAEALGPNRVLPDAKSPSVAAAASVINSGLSTTTSKGSNIIGVAYQNQKPAVATAVLNELVTRYFTKHLEVHRSAGAFDFVSQQTDQIHARLNQTEDQLKKLKAQTGVMSFQDSVSSLTGQVTHLDDQIRAAESDLAEQQAKVKQIEQSGALLNVSEAERSKDTAKDITKDGAKANANDATPTPAPQGPSSKEVGDYQALMANLDHLRETQLEMSAKYTDQNPLVKMNQAHIADMENQKRTLEKKYPELLSLQKGVGQMDLRGERVRLAGMKSKVDDMIRQKAELQERMKQFADIGPQITNLERTKEMDEQNYKYYSATLQKARVDEALDPSKMPNISAIQRPSPPGLVTTTRDKIVYGIAGGGLALGLGIALLSELVLSRVYKRRSEIERQLRSPVMLSIPYQKQSANGRLRLPWKNGQGAGTQTPEKSKSNLAPWEVEHFIRPYSEAVRDRLGLYFELHGVTHKPKLIGVTGFNDGVGTSTLAAGVAAALSETGDGKVLLVDVNATNGEVHPFFAGRPAAALTTAIKPQAPITSAAENLYLATVNQSGSKSTHLGLKKFFALVPNLKASDFDYIIFDMPPITQTSPTIGLAALMDKVLLVVEAEKTTRDTVKRGYRELVGARADVAVVLNKTRTYGPNWLESAS
jgi:polysaccharide biosynthesis transport protein